MLKALFSPRRKLFSQAREIRELRHELATLRTQNESMRAGMRRCVSCDYRLEIKRRQDGIVEHLG